MRSAPWKNGAWLVWLAIYGAGAIGCSTQQDSVGGDTHWLEACTDDAACERGSCLCGVCTERCTGDAQCAGGVEARCAKAASLELVAVCGPGAEPPGELPGICLATAAAPDAATPDAAQPPAPVSERPSRRASELADLEPSASLSFEDEVVPVPEPERSFRDPAEALLGTWKQPDCDPADGETQFFDGGCVLLTFERSGPHGEIVGRLDSYTEVDTSSYALPRQTFAPATDPSVGYPVEATPEDYRDFGTRMGPYTMLDPRFDGENLQFWVSPLELWEGWCALQTSYRVPGGNPPYQCVPDGAANGDPEVDRGKLALCTSAWSSGACDPKVCGLSAAEPCPPESYEGCGCYTPEGVWDEALPECSIAYCRCDAQGCAPNWYENRIDFQLVVAGDRMVGREGFLGGFANMGVLQREVAP